MQFECGTRILRVIHRRDARATSAKCITTREAGSAARRRVVMQFECGTRILRVIHGRDARATSAKCITTREADDKLGSIRYYAEPNVRSKKQFGL